MSDAITTTTIAGPVNIWAPFEKVAVQPDGTLIVDVTYSTERPDDQGEVVDYDALKKAAGDYMTWGAVNEMHRKDNAAGVALSVDLDDELRKASGQIHVVDPVAVLKVQTGVYKGVSIEGQRLGTRMDKVAGKTVQRVIDLRWTRTALADRPSNPDATLTIAKRSDPEADAAVVEVTAPATIPAEPLAKSATDDAFSAALIVDCLNRLIEGEAGEADQAALLTRARDIVVRFYAQEVAEVGTPEDQAEIAEEEAAVIPIAMIDLAYAAVSGDLAKAALELHKTGGAYEPAPAITELAARIAALIPPVTATLEAAAAPVFPDVEALAKSAMTSDDVLAKITSIVASAIGTPATAADAEAMQATLAEMKGELAKVAVAVGRMPTSGGPLSTFAQDAVFGRMSAGATDEAAVLRKYAETAVDPAQRAVFAQAAAVAEARTALNNPVPVPGMRTG